ncbi:MAG: GTP-binding protein [Marinilabiliaceae bacterium]|nr:GTP-binding protein [Marinilabiliaceae bacterium]
MIDDRIAVTVITGFLGAGKTTLLNNIIRKHPEKKFAIIENEFGEVGVDSGLIVDAGDAIVELANGCICCSLNQDFQLVLNQLLDGPFEFDHLLIETTGIADPLSVVKHFIHGGNIQFRFRMDSVICLADAIHLEDLLEEQSEVKQQLALSDLVLLNKAGDVPSEYVEKMQQQIRRINPMARVQAIRYGQIDHLKVLDTFAYSGQAIAVSTLAYRPVNEDHLVENPTHVQHDIVSEGFVINQPFNQDGFSTWLQSFLFFNEKAIYRAKGILSFQGKSEQYIFHSIRGTLMMEPGEKWGDKTAHSKIVFIGKQLNRQAIEENLLQFIQ